MLLYQQARAYRIFACAPSMDPSLLNSLQSQTKDLAAKVSKSKIIKYILISIQEKFTTFQG